jgi:peptidoglycan/LPS O-acetylase OafA/YrhL
MYQMQIPFGYLILTAAFVLLCLAGLVVAGWSRQKTAVSAMLGMCAIASIFVIDVITNGTVMNVRLALVLVGVGVVLMVPLALKRLGAVRRARRSRPATRRPNSPDGPHGSRVVAAG